MDFVRVESYRLNQGDHFLARETFVGTRAESVSLTRQEPPRWNITGHRAKFEDQYDARKLGNWENRKWFPDRPRQRTKTTKIIANDNGHLLEGVKRENPWGTYQGTWDLPRRITREFAEKLAAPPERLLARWQKKSAPKQEKKAQKGEKESQLEGEKEVGSACSEAKSSYAVEKGSESEKAGKVEREAEDEEKSCDSSCCPDSGNGPRPRPGKR